MVQSTAKVLHARRCPSLLLKVDISCAFDSVTWPFLLEVLRHLGFPKRWCDSIATILSLASTRIILNGNPGSRICHARGLRQGDSLSHMLFLLVMEVLNGLHCRADEWLLLGPFGVRPIAHCASLYADDLVVFISPEAQDLDMLHLILHLFEGSSDLSCILAKCSMVAIRCSEEQIADSMLCFPCELVQFLIRYLAIPLSVFKLPRTTLQPMLDKAADKLPSWNEQLQHCSSRLSLIKLTLTTIPVYMAISVGMPQ
jgi:hypothetical protein